VILSFAALATMVVGGLRFGNPQWGRAFYLFQRHVWPGNRIRVPERYTGTWTQWHSNGRKALEAKFSNGKANGRMTFWDRQGRKEQQRMYREDVQHGKEVTWDRHGNIVAEGTYVDGKKWQGTFAFPPGGSPNRASVQRYENGVAVGPREYYVLPPRAGMPLRRITPPDIESWMGPVPDKE
jgi:hypothetical protein